MRIFLYLLTVFTFLLAGGNAFSAKEQTQYQIMFSTFENQSAGNLAYLRDSIEGMLISRLAARDRIDVIENSLSEQELKKLKKGKDFLLLKTKGYDVDYLVTGRLVAVASGLNVQVTLYPIDDSKEVLNFSILTESTDSLIKDVDNLAGEIAEGGFGYRAVATDTAQTTGSNSGIQGFTTVHPEAAYKKGLYTGTVIGSEIAGFQAKAIGVKRKLSFEGEITAFTVEDVNGDGEQEIFTLEGNNLSVYRIIGRKISKVASVGLSSRLRIHALNIADINRDGKFEIYLSATDGLNITSLIMSWSEAGGFTTLARNIPWYIRPMYIPKLGVQLAGQQRGVEKINLVRSGVQLLEIDENYTLLKGKKLPLPSSINLFDFTYGDIDGDGYHELLVIDDHENLKVYSPSNELIWISNRKFGGSKTYLGPSQGTAVNERDNFNFTVDEDADRDLIFVPGRISVTDINRDGKDEVVVTENSMSTFGFFKRMRPYKAGMVVGLVWSNDEFVEAWRTGRYRGYLADYSFNISDSSEKKSETSGLLYVANIPQSGSFTSMLPMSVNTNFSVYELGFSKAKTE